MAAAIRNGLDRLGWRGFPARKVRLWAEACGLAALLATAGCATTGSLTPGSSPEAKRAAVQERAIARWQAIIKGDYAGAYEYLSSASRQMVTLPAFEARAKMVAFRDVKIGAIDCEDETCKVKLTVTYDHRVMQGVPASLEEVWIIDQGRFWYVWSQ